MRHAVPATFVIDAGGSTTRVEVRRADGHSADRRWPSVNPASADEREVAGRWAEILGWLAEGGAPAVGWIASASVTAHTVDHIERTLTEAARRAGLAGRAVLSNDILPLLLAPPVAGNGIALVVGTGSACVALRGGRSARVGGHEYVLSDDGSGYRIGLAGLRAAMRAHDGTAPETALLPAAERFGGCSMPELGRQLAQRSGVKGRVASFASEVIAAASAGDAPALAIVAGAADELVAMVAAAHGRVTAGPDPAGGPTPPTLPLVVVGSTVHRSTYFRDLLVARLAQWCPTLTVTVLPDALRSTWHLAGDLATAADPLAGIEVGDEVLRAVRFTA